MDITSLCPHQPCVSYQYCIVIPLFFILLALPVSNVKVLTICYNIAFRFFMKFREEYNKCMRNLKSK
uniref:Uncharacterized protein n=1 Tax=Plectreurys tristis TaxID=33319 RepID=A0A0B4VRT4_PLETR|nr:hypothetical protein [Plectreurys tristis]